MTDIPGPILVADFPVMLQYINGMITSSNECHGVVFIRLSLTSLSLSVLPCLLLSASDRTRQILDMQMKLFKKEESKQEPSSSLHSQSYSALSLSGNSQSSKATPIGFVGSDDDEPTLSMVD